MDTKLLLALLLSKGLADRTTCEVPTEVLLKECEAVVNEGRPLTGIEHALLQLELACMGYYMDSEPRYSVLTSLDTIINTVRRVSRGDYTPWVPLADGFPTVVPDIDNYLLVRLLIVTSNLMEADDGHLPHEAMRDVVSLLCDTKVSLTEAVEVRLEQLYVQAQDAQLASPYRGYKPLDLVSKMEAIDMAVEEGLI
jgi:hypothetical protein